jgi:hypothetical protein
MKRVGANVDMSDDLLTIENEKSLRMLMASEEVTPITTTEGGDNAVDDKDIYVERFGLSEDEIADALKQNESLRLAQQATAVKTQIAAWESEKKSPAVLKEAERILLADPGTIAVNLSEEDGDTVKPLTLSDVVKALVNASPALELEVTRVTEEAQTAGTAPVETEVNVELSADVKKEARRLFLDEGLSEADAIEKAKAKFAAKAAE